MASRIIFIVVLYLSQAVYSQTNWASPCPRLFTYEPPGQRKDRWYGIVTLLTDSDLNGIWLRLIFDKPSLMLGNWFGQVDTKDNQEYLIKNREKTLKANTPHTIRFFIQYNPNEEPPMLKSFRLNAKTICPEGFGATESPTTEPQLQTSNVRLTTNQPFIQSGNAPNLQGGASDDDVFPSDFGLIKNPNARPVAEIECGTVVTNPRPLITHGQAAREGEFPWHVALYTAKGINLEYICGGSLISKTHVVTAAHCVTKIRTKTPVNPDNLLIYLGKYYLRQWSNTGIQDRQISKVIVHPDYDGRTFRNDLALLKLVQTAEFNDYVRPVCLWEGTDDVNRIVDKEGTIAGWGFNENGKLTEHLTKTKMPVVSKETCIYSYPEFFSRFTTEKTYCAGYRNGTSACSGDSGGGMVFPKSATSRPPAWHLRGLISVSAALQSDQLRCDTSSYIVFTDLAKYISWIRKEMQA